VNPELITLAVLAAPAAVIGPICLAGHALARRREAAVANAFRNGSQPRPPSGPGESEPAPDARATVLSFPARRASGIDHAA
jgi:hypothetical protein